MGETSNLLYPSQMAKLKWGYFDHSPVDSPVDFRGFPMIFPARNGSTPLATSRWRLRILWREAPRALSCRTCGRTMVVLPSGSDKHSYGQSPCLLGKLTVSMAIFTSKPLIYQRVAWFNQVKMLIWPVKLESFGIHFRHFGQAKHFKKKNWRFNDKCKFHQQKIAYFAVKLWYEPTQNFEMWGLNRLT